MFGVTVGVQCLALILIPGAFHTRGIPSECEAELRVRARVRARFKVLGLVGVCVWV